MKDGNERRRLLRRAAQLVAGFGAAVVARPASVRITLRAASQAMTLRSDAFQDGQAIPVRFTCDGENVSPPLSWSEPPPGTRSFALFCTDPDAPAGTFHHWGVFDLPAHLRRLDEGFSKTGGIPGARQAVNDFGKPGYGGPCPPQGHGVHHYHFEIFALDAARLDPPADARVANVRRAAVAHVLARGELIGTYRR